MYALLNSLEPNIKHIKFLSHKIVVATMTGRTKHAKYMQNGSKAPARGRRLRDLFLPTIAAAQVRSRMKKWSSAQI
jgi:hypothetical protein